MNDLCRPVEILLIEDNPGEVRLTREALKIARVRCNLTVAQDGEEALSFLYRRGKHFNASRPDLIILDLNLPKKDGLAVLAEVKSDPHLRSIPIVVMTTSEAEEDIRGSYDLHANCYITKPVDLEGFIQVIRSIEMFWLQMVKLPPHGPGRVSIPKPSLLL